MSSPSELTPPSGDSPENSDALRDAGAGGQVHPPLPDAVASSPFVPPGGSPATAPPPAQPWAGVQPPRGQPSHGQPPAQHPPGQVPQGQHPGQQYPGAQYTGQQYPGAQASGQQYLGAQYSQGYYPPSQHAPGQYPGAPGQYPPSTAQPAAARSSLKGTNVAFGIAIGAVALALSFVASGFGLSRVVPGALLLLVALVPVVGAVLCIPQKTRSIGLGILIAGAAFWITGVGPCIALFNS